MSDLPKGWSQTTIEEISSQLFAGGDVPKNNFSKEKTDKYSIPIFGNGIKDNGLYGYTDIEKVSLSCITISARGTIGHSILRTEGFYPIVRLIVVIPFDIVCLNYIDYVIKNLDFENSGTSIPQLTIPMVREVILPLPPLAEQKRIVAKLDSLFEELDSLKERLANIPTLMKNFRQAVLTQAVTGKLTEEWREGRELGDMYEFIQELSKKREVDYKEAVKYAKDNKLKKPKKDYEFEFSKHPEKDCWCIAKLDNLIYMSARIGWKGLKADEYTETGPLFLSVHSLNYGTNVNYDVAYHITEERYEESPEIMLQENDILLCKDGAGIGKLGIVKDLEEQATVNSSLLVLRGREVLNYKFFYYFLLGPSLQNIAQERITGTAIPHLFQRDIKEFNVEIPSLEEQEEIVKQVDRLFAQADAIEERYELLKEKIEQLPQAILAKAFKGELVEQLPTDGDAKDLLEEIKALKESMAKKPKKKKTTKKKVVLKEGEQSEIPFK